MLTQGALDGYTESALNFRDACLPVTKCWLSVPLMKGCTESAFREYLLDLHLTCFRTLKCTTPIYQMSRIWLWNQNLMFPPIMEFTCMGANYDFDKRGHIIRSVNVRCCRHVLSTENKWSRDKNCSNLATNTCHCTGCMDLRKSQLGQGAT
jgi:hypothetical protein